MSPPTRGQSSVLEREGSGWGGQGRLREGGREGKGREGKGREGKGRVGHRGVCVRAREVAICALHTPRSAFTYAMHPCHHLQRALSIHAMHRR
eukprot:2286022-Rhodomonas_salina.2